MDWVEFVARADTNLSFPVGGGTWLQAEEMAGELSLTPWGPHKGGDRDHSIEVPLVSTLGAPHTHILIKMKAEGKKSA